MTQTSRRASWVNDVLLRLTAASGVGYLATAYSVSRWLTRRCPAHPVPPILPGVELELLRCRTSDRLLLHGWAFTPPQPRGTVAIFHGLRLNRTQTVGRIALLAAAGYRCVAFDHRAHGESQGKRSSFGYHEGRDVEAVAELIGRRWPAQPCAALGISMGAAAVCFAAGKLPCYRAFVLESVYHELAAAFQHRVGCGYPSWFGRFRRGIVWVTERRLRVRIGNVAPLAHVNSLAPRPVLFLTGTNDPHAPPHEVRPLHERCPGSEMRLIPGAGHLDLFEKGGMLYRDTVLAFLQRHLA